MCRGRLSHPVSPYVRTTLLSASIAKLKPAVLWWMFAPVTLHNLTSQMIRDAATCNLVPDIVALAAFQPYGHIARRLICNAINTKCGYKHNP